MFNGNTIRVLRAAKGWKQQDLANAAKVERSQISRFENGKTVPDLITAYRLAAALGVSIDLFFAGDVHISAQAL